jgi:hypothetical protein
MVALGLGVSAQADIVTVVDAVETITSNISIPTSTNGRLMFRPCSEKCDEKFIVVRLTPESKFIVSGQHLNFNDFRDAFLRVRQNGDDYALVSYATKTNTVTSVNIGQ